MNFLLGTLPHQLTTQHTKDSHCSHPPQNPDSDGRKEEHLGKQMETGVWGDCLKTASIRFSIALKKMFSHYILWIRTQILVSKLALWPLPIQISLYNYTLTHPHCCEGPWKTDPGEASSNKHVTHIPLLSTSLCLLGKLMVEMLPSSTARKLGREGFVGDTLPGIQTAPKFGGFIFKRTHCQ